MQLAAPALANPTLSGSLTRFSEAYRGSRARAYEGFDFEELRARIAETCLAEAGVECRICGENCPTGAIRFRPRLGGVAQPQLDVAACTGCGACFAPCPTRAIVVKAQIDIRMENEQ